MIQKIWLWCKHSATLVVARIGMAVSTVPFIIDTAADLFDEPRVKEQLSAFLAPKTVALIGFFAFIAIEVARRRRSSLDPIPPIGPLPPLPPLPPLGEK